jgi:putative transposase
MLVLYMASKNSIKSDVTDGFYHVYNRGVGRMEIFKDDQDYGVFLSYLKEYLSPKQEKNELIHKIYVQDRVFNGVARTPKNYHNKFELICYCLMPNHFHFLIKQPVSGSMKNFMHSLLLRYSMYFNKKYDRVGPLFQGRYKAVFVESEEYLLYLSRYIHVNPGEFTNNLLNAKSSYADFIGLKHTSWLNPDKVLVYFNNKILPGLTKVNTYKNFVEGDTGETNIDANLLLD